MHVKQMLGLGVIVVAGSACAPVPTDSKSYQPSLIEQVLAKKPSTGQPINPPSAQRPTTSPPSAPQAITPSPTQRPAKANLFSRLMNKSSDEPTAAKVIKPQLTPQPSDQLLDKMIGQSSAMQMESNPAVENDAAMISTKDKPAVATETTKPTLLTTRDQENIVRKSQQPSTELLFTINTPSVNLINLTGKSLSQLIKTDVFNKDQLDQSLSNQLYQTQIFQPKTNNNQTTGYFSKLRSLGQKKSPAAAPANTNQADGDLFLETKLILNKTNDPRAIGATLHFMVSESVTGDAIADSRTYAVLTDHQNDLNNLLSTAVDALLLELTNNWQAR